MKKIFTIAICLLFVSWALLLGAFMLYNSKSNSLSKNEIPNISPTEQQPSDVQKNDEPLLPENQTIPDTPSDTQNTTDTAIQKIAYLTIDDGPSSVSTPKVLDVLDKNNIKATFFMIGKNMENHPDQVRAIHSKGHAIGNHSYSHVYKSLYANIENFTEEIQKTENIIFQITGTTSKLFRAPGGSPNIRKKELLDQLDNMGYIFYDWNVVSGDGATRAPTEKEAFENMTKITKNQTVAMILMHDTAARPETLNVLPSVIEWYKERGFVFKIIDENVKPIQFVK